MALPAIYIVNSYCAIVTQERQKVGYRNYATRIGHSKRAKTLAIQANHFTNKGFMYGPSPS